MRLWRFLLKRRRLILLLALLLIFFKLTNSYFDDSVMSYVEIKSQEVFEEVITKTIEEEIADTLDEDIMKLKYDDNGNIAYAYMDSHQALSIRSCASNKIVELSNGLEDAVSKMKIPLGYFFTKNILFSDGITLPVKLNVYKAYDCEISSNVESFGINSQLYEIILNVRMSVYIQIPFQRKLTILEDKIILSSGIMNNEIPKYYFGDNTPFLTISDNEE